jgi:hypothetical protein
LRVELLSWKLRSTHNHFHGLIKRNASPTNELISRSRNPRPLALLLHAETPRHRWRDLFSNCEQVADHIETFSSSPRLSLANRGDSDACSSCSDLARYPGPYWWHLLHHSGHQVAGSVLQATKNRRQTPAAFCCSSRDKVRPRTNVDDHDSGVGTLCMTFCCSAGGSRLTQRRQT